MRDESIQKTEMKAERRRWAEKSAMRTSARIDEDEMMENNHWTLQSLTEHLYLFEYRLSMV